MGETRAEDIPFPAEADLTAAATIGTGPVGRFQLVCAAGIPGEPPSAFLLDTIDGRSWVRDRSTNGQWRPIHYSPGSPPAAP
jgi:hypothetical protein